MNKKTLIKRFFIVLIVFAFFIFIKHQVYAKDLEEIAQMGDELKGKIVKYDTLTKEASVIDAKDIKNEVDREVKLYKNSTIQRKINNRRKRGSFVNPFSLDAEIFEPSNTSEYPYNSVGRINFTTFNGRVGYGTGFLVGKGLVVTAAHCVLNTGNDNVYSNGQLVSHTRPLYAMEEEFLPGYRVENGNVVGSGEWSGKYLTYYVPGDYVTSVDKGENYYFGSDNYDWALCILNNRYENLDYIDIARYETNEEYNNLKIESIGYPSSESNGTVQYRSIDNVMKVNDYTFETNNSIKEGMSGGPMLTGDSTAIAINVSTDVSADNADTVGVKIAEDLIELVTNLRANGF